MAKLADLIWKNAELLRGAFKENCLGADGAVGTSLIKPVLIEDLVLSPCTQGGFSGLVTVGTLADSVV